jgi:hypothetical protein
MQGRHLTAFWQQGMDAELWGDIWYTTFTTVRTAILTPCIMLLVFTVLRLAGHRSLAESTLFNKISVVALGSLVGGAALRPNTPIAAVAVATVIIIGVSVVVSILYMWGWIPGCVLRPQPILVWVDGEYTVQFAELPRLRPWASLDCVQPLGCYVSTSMSDCHLHAGAART